MTCATNTQEAEETQDSLVLNSLTANPGSHILICMKSRNSIFIDLTIVNFCLGHENINYVCIMPQQARVLGAELIRFADEQEAR